MEDMNARKLSTGTQKGHLRACRQFAAFLKRSPDTASSEDIPRPRSASISSHRSDPTYHSCPILGDHLCLFGSPRQYSLVQETSSIEAEYRPAPSGLFDVARSPTGGAVCTEARQSMSRARRAWPSKRDTRALVPNLGPAARLPAWPATTRQNGRTSGWVL